MDESQVLSKRVPRVAAVSPCHFPALDSPSRFESVEDDRGLETVSLDDVLSKGIKFGAFQPATGEGLQADELEDGGERVPRRDEVLNVLVT